MLELHNYIAGEWSAPGVELPQQICNANTGEVLLQQRGSTPVQISTAIDAAVKVHREGTWRNLSGDERAAHMLRIGDAIEELIKDIASVDAITTGVPITHTQTLARVCGIAFRTAAKLSRESSSIRRETDFEIERLPLGPAAIIAPWNAPAGIACHKLASALAAGCPVLFKPSEWAPLSGQLITQAISKLDLPRGLFQLIHGDGMTGAALAGDPRVAAVSFTGGLEAGRAVAASCAHQIKPAQLELGGNNPLVILPDADLAPSVDGVVASLTTLNGQWCRALGRLIVHEDLHDDVVETVLHRLNSLVIGDSRDHETEMGPMVHRQHRDHVLAAISDYEQLGGTVHRAGTLPELAGWFLQPTLVTGVAPADALGEIFGPVATVHKFSNTDEAVSLANLAPYGLAAYVFGGQTNAYTVAKQIEAGMVKINSVTLFSPHPDAPRPAWKMSGMGEEGTRETFEFFRGSRVVGAPQGIPASAAAEQLQGTGT
ncbi:MAG: aldehyde dehydrogenase family protein [Gammaproteobacteria bacterium]|nr:aldehyde dehydrogenase family protein [Gammaproteobacteria bacterium]